MKKIYSIITGLVLFTAYCIWQWTPTASDYLQLTMLNIGQGDAIHIRTPHGTDILVDGGPNRSILSELGQVMPSTDHTIELVIATHPDADHIAGLVELPDAYTVQTLITNGTTKSTGVSEALDRWEGEGVQVLHAARGWTMDIEEGLWLEFLHPDPPRFHEDTNEDSVVFLLHYGEFTALFTGDATIENEKEIVDHYSPSTGFDVDLLKVGHHGSRTSTGQELIDATTPAIALISVGQENTFGHPHAGPLHRLQQGGAEIWRTDTHGRVVCTVLQNTRNAECTAADTQ